MTVQVLFVQGAGANVHDVWDSKLVQSLERELGADYSVQYPLMPGEEAPRYAAWKPVLLEKLNSLQDGAILVGHSVGGTVLLHVLVEERPKLRPGALFLIAPPYIGDGGWPSDDIKARTDFSEHLPATLPVFLYHGIEDESVPFAHAGLYAKTMPQAVVRALNHRDHQLNNELSEVAQDIRSLISRRRT
jgi:predicted alpha/beta hydrolase family esterase